MVNKSVRVVNHVSPFTERCPRAWSHGELLEPDWVSRILSTIIRPELSWCELGYMLWSVSPGYKVSIRGTKQLIWAFIGVRTGGVGRHISRVFSADFLKNSGKTNAFRLQRCTQTNLISLNKGGAEIMNSTTSRRRTWCISCGESFLREPACYGGDMILMMLYDT